MNTSSARWISIRCRTTRRRRCVLRIAGSSSIRRPLLRAMGDILDKYGADYIVVNGRIPPDVVALYWKPDLAAARALTERLKSAAPVFEMLYERNDLALFRFAGAGDGAALSAARGVMPFAGDSVTERDLARCAESGQPGIFIKGVEVSRARVKRGDTLQVHITWVSQQKQPLQRYMGYLRFDTGFPRNALYRAVVRKALSQGAREHETRAVSFPHRFPSPEGDSAPDTWPPFREMHDTVTVSVPLDVASGAYTVSLRMEITPQFPNYHVRDFFIDRDYYSGVRVARIAIE